MPIPNSVDPGVPSSDSSSSFSQAKAETSEAGQRAADMLDATRGTAARGLDSAANALHDQADSLPGGEKIAKAAHKTADAAGSAADYVRANDLKSMLGDVQQLVKNNPGTALLTAAALGFLIARTFSSRD
jgi:ElaB/YqjD/DUF883 family membrane-anchored ribosome-binding protein